MKIVFRNIGYIFLLASLGIVYIYNSNSAERKLRDIATLKKAVEDAKSEYQEVKSDINFRCTESQLAKTLEQKGMVVNRKVPLVIELDES